MKKWLSRGIVLAMVVAMMIPAPVLAKSKSSSGGKLVKSVEIYHVRDDSKGWRLDGKIAYQYDKKNNPKEIKYTNYTKYVAGIPVGANVSTQTAKYKYKGKTPKKSTFKNEVGTVVEKRTYKKGRAVNVTREDLRTYNDDGSDAYYDAYVDAADFYKNGLVASEAEYYAQKSSEGEDNYKVVSSYAWDQKKGIPKSVVAARTVTGTDHEEGSFTYTDSFYTLFNNKGLGIESGWVNPETNKMEANTSITYTMKKGLVKEAVVYGVGEDGKVKALTMLKFKYGKTKISKKRYMNMVNTLVAEKGMPEYYMGFGPWMYLEFGGLINGYSYWY